MRTFANYSDAKAAAERIVRELANGSQAAALKIQKVRCRHPLKGKKHRGVSWKLIEILDRKQNGIGKLNASQRLPVSRRTLFSWRTTGKIPFVRLGGRRVIFHWPSVEAALLRMQNGGAYES